MSAVRRNSECVTAEQAVAMFHARLDADPALRERLAREDAERKQRAAAADAVSAPILDELREHGVDVESVWDIHKVPGGKATASPVLVAHLKRGGYPRLLMQGMAHALDVDWVRAHWEQVRELYTAPHDAAVSGPLAAALRRAGRKAQVDDMIAMLTDESLPESRLMFVQKVLQVGGERGRAVVESLRDDPVVGKEATARLKRRGR